MSSIQLAMTRHWHGLCASLPPHCIPSFLCSRSGQGANQHESASAETVLMPLQLMTSQKGKCLDMPRRATEPCRKPDGNDQPEDHHSTHDTGNMVNQITSCSSICVTHKYQQIKTCTYTDQYVVISMKGRSPEGAVCCGRGKARGVWAVYSNALCQLQTADVLPVHKQVYTSGTNSAGLH